MNFPNITLEELLTAWAAGNLSGAELVLLIGVPDYDALVIVEADLVKATFGGYVDTVVAAWTQYADTAGRPYLAGAPIVYNTTSAVALPQSIVAAALMQGTDIIAIGPLDNPIFVSVNDQTFHVRPVVGISQAGTLEFHGQTP